MPEEIAIAIMRARKMLMPAAWAARILAHRDQR